MTLGLAWVGEEAYDRVALARHRCYAPASGRRERFDDSVRLDGRQRPGDFLLASRGAADVGTATALSLNMWVRGRRLPCQGVAYVGTIKTQRRGGAGAERGVASQLMEATVARGREREQVVSALMPFRASFYEHFGFGNAEHRVEWTVPLALLPRGDFDGYRFYEPPDDAAILALRAREARVGQCDVETDAPALATWQRFWGEGTMFVDERLPGTLDAYVYVLEERGPQTATAVVEDWAAADPAALLRMLSFLASLKDQYTFARITLPRDVPLNRLLRETQVPHRQVDHPVATARPYTRMQLRVLDHQRFLDGTTLGANVSGKLNVSILESEKHVTRLALNVDAGRCTSGSTAGEADVSTTDVIWASIVTGDLLATQAHALGLIEARSRESVVLLDAFAAGPAPFCQEYF